MPDRQADEGTLRVVIYGGSNSFMGGGYVSFLKDELARVSGRAIAIENNAMGNTFVHFGLYLASRFAAFADADVVVVEYAINDQELFNHRCEPFWRSGYEGLLRKIRAGNRRALLCSLILYPERHFVMDRPWKLANEIKGLTAAYGGFSLDVAEELRRASPDEIADIRSVYRNGTHYAKRFQGVIAGLLAEALARQLGAPPGTLPAACAAPRDYSGCVILGEGIAGRIGGSTILPPASDEPRRFNLIDILHTGDIRPGP